MQDAYKGTGRIKKVKTTLIILTPPPRPRKDNYWPPAWLKSAGSPEAEVTVLGEENFSFKKPAIRTRPFMFSLKITKFNSFSSLNYKETKWLY
jgi:hypothetical protein